jgi:hypothetical protein
MTLNVDSLAASMTAALPAALSAAQIAAGQLTEDISKKLPVEIKKLATQLAAIEQAGFSKEVARTLLEERLASFEDVFIALPEVTLTHVERLVNELLKIVKDVVNAAVKFPLI